MNLHSAIAFMDAISIMNGQKTISEMITEIPVRKAHQKPHQGAKEIARRKRTLASELDMSNKNLNGENPMSI